MQPYSQRKRKRISLWGCNERRRGREKNKLFLERRQSQEKKYSFHPERSSAIFHRADEQQTLLWQPRLALWYQFSYFFSRGNRKNWFCFMRHLITRRTGLIVKFRSLRPFRSKLCFLIFIFPEGTGRLDFDDFIYCFMLHLITGWFWSLRLFRSKLCFSYFFSDEPKDAF